MIYNTFFFPGKVPSMNELLYAKASAQKKGGTWLLDRNKGKQTFQWNRYNDIKKDWSARVLKIAERSKAVFCGEAFFSYMIVEHTKRRDPSNIAASAIKFIEDGLIKARVIPNDGWDNVLGINTYWIHTRDIEAGIYLAMSSERLSEKDFMGCFQDDIVKRSNGE